LEKVTGIGGMFFRARDPKTLSRWYATHLGIDVDDAVWRQVAGPTVFAPFRESTDYFSRPEQQWMINFRVRDLDAMLRQLRAAGIAAETRSEWIPRSAGSRASTIRKATRSSFGSRRRTRFPDPGFRY